VFGPLHCKDLQAFQLTAEKVALSPTNEPAHSDHHTGGSTARCDGGMAGAAATAAAAMRSSSRDPRVNMFEVLSEERAQLCLTLAEGADTVNVYLAARAESWPVGMVPGFSTVQASEC